MKNLMRWFQFFRQVLGDGDYDRYCEHMKRKHPGMKPMSARRFYLSRLEEKYSRPQRCC
ncbi:MAG: YbdD/YjiX family protein [Acidobacteria bacterium]|nr:YbdD/YjiX family protein [Acidobacteriota bacterium]